MKNLVGVFVLLLGGLSFVQSDSISEDWPEYLGGPDRNHYSTLTQINKQNVKDLKPLWVYAAPDSGQMQVNTIIIKGVLYGVTASVQAFAIDATTGKEIWRFGDPLKTWHSTSRGVAYWKKGNDERILYTAGPNLWALDAKTGKPIHSFGQNGKTDLHQGLPAIAQDKFIISNTPGTIFEDLIIMPVRLSEGADAAPGDIRAFNVITGKLVWSFHTIPYPGEFGYNTFPPDAYKNEYTGAANNWAGMAIDHKNGLLFVPTGSAGYDFYGGNRKGENLFSNCLLALDARTGKRKWHFQTTHHDMWDRDLPAPPNLMTLNQNGKKVEAVVQISKQGFVFAFERTTGKPIFEIKEVKVNTKALAGEYPWPTQPRPSLPLPFTRQSQDLIEADISPFAQNRDELIQNFKTYKKGFYDPPSKEGTIVFPGFDGGAEWGGAAADPSGILYVNANEMPWIQTMKATDNNNYGNLTLGEKVYKNNCISCHGANKKGNPKSNYPSLVDIGKKRNLKYINEIITGGKGMMPGFGNIKNNDLQALTEYILDIEKKEVTSNSHKDKVHAKAQLPFQMTGYNKWLDKAGLPAIAPPWGTLNAIDMNTGQYKWKINLGNETSLGVKGNNTGTENYGGPIITASGLLFIAATKDGMFRAFDKENGQLLWQTKLPAAAFATPSTYMVNGKQYIVIACGGTKLGTPKGNSFVAFGL